MNAKEIINRLGGVSEEVLKEALQCQTEDELLALADRKGAELTEGEATELFGLLRSQAEGMSLEQLEMVTGGLKVLGTTGDEEGGNPRV